MPTAGQGGHDGRTHRQPDAIQVPGDRDEDDGSPPSELRPFEPVSDTLLLAAVDRAERHRTAVTTAASKVEGVPLWQVVDHLGFLRGSWTTRRLRPQIDALESTGLLAGCRRHGIAVWALTSTGRRRLETARQAGEVGDLPESPQHRAWRHARAAASERIDGFREQVHGAVNEASGLLATSEVRSDAWLALGERLQRACWQLASASHCLSEWGEPDERRPDVDEYREVGDEALDQDERRQRRLRRTGRRNTRTWDNG